MLDPETIIKRLGGTVAVAKLCQCKPPTVSEWKQPGRRIPPARLQFLQLARPDVFAPESAPAPEGQPQ